MQKPHDTESYVNNELDTPTPGGSPLNTDQLETLQPGVKEMPDSPSSEADAGLIDPTCEDEDTDEDTIEDSFMGDEPLSLEIPMSDLQYAEPQLHSPVQSSMNAPGEIDIEELDEDAVRDLLPPDARLDPLED